MSDPEVWTVSRAEWDQIEAILTDDGPPHPGLVELLKNKGVFND